MNHFTDYDNERLLAQLSGERFSVTYRLYGTETECLHVAKEITVEQSVEFPFDLLPPGAIPERIVGQIEEFCEIEDKVFETKISFPVENALPDFTQFLNVVFGNFSLKPNVQVVGISISPSLLASFKGPKFGIEGIRSLVGVEDRPVLFSALKPLGLSSDNLARVAGILAENGIEIIKDDHGIADQIYAPFKERVKRCADAVQEANARSGHHALYVPNISAPFYELRERALYAQECGAGGLMVAPGLIGFDAMKSLAEDHDIHLPIFSHPAFSGSMTVNERQGISLPVFFGLLMRLAGADATIFPNYGGRFTFSKKDCIEICEQGKKNIGDIKPMFVCPAGGMKLEKVPDMIASYGRDVMLLIGGGLFSYGEDLAANCRYFNKTVCELSASV
ncbi:MAG: ribulose 1,5-bisphosphate carboxylase large subunit [Oscillospiraceae bacterium]|nr:ribulose 1,5-bisphosphate carboxylase large subunit [Oscillospiraceae bacterium]